MKVHGRGLGFLFGIVGAVLLFLLALVSFISGIIFLALGHSVLGTLGSTLTRVVLSVVLGILVGIFASWGSHGGHDGAVTGGVVLVDLAVVVWLVLGFGLLAALAGLFTLLAGILFLVEGR